MPGQFNIANLSVESILQIHKQWCPYKANTGTEGSVTEQNSTVEAERDGASRAKDLQTSLEQQQLHGVVDAVLGGMQYQNRRQPES
jgi:hypothetical protein